MQTTSAVCEHQACCGEVVRRRDTRRCQRVPPIGSPSDAKRADIVAGEASRAEIRPRRTSVVTSEQTLVVPLDRGIHCRDQTTASCAVTLLATRGVSEFDSGPRCEGLHGTDEVGVLHLLHKGEDVACGITAKAFVATRLFAHVE